MSKVPKASGRPSKFIDTAVKNKETKASVIESAGFTQKQVERFQQLAAHPEMVEAAGISPRVNVRGLPCG